MESRASSSEDNDLLTQFSTSESALKAKVHQYYDEVSKALNPIELLPLLMKEQLLDFNERSVILEDNSKSTYEKSRYILRSLEAKGPSAYSKFLNCLKEEESHMGHDYIASLLQEKAFGSKLELEESSQLKKAIQKHYKEMMDLSLELLVPLIYGKKLLTENEKQKLLSQHNKTRSERILLLLHLLDTKGPLAHRLFVKCLQSESRSHPTHKELYDKLTSFSVPTATCTPRKQECIVNDHALAVALLCGKLFRRWELQEPLKGERYSNMMCEFVSCIENGDWKRLEIEATKYEKFLIPEYKVVICLVRARSWVVRKNPETVLQHVGEAKQIIEAEIYGDNYHILLGRSERVLSYLFRYLKDFEKAREHIEKAKKLLFGVKPGEDTAYVHYDDACIRLECLDKLPMEREFKCIVELFARAISDDRSHENRLEFLATCAPLRLAQMHLGSTHYTPGTATDDANIRSAQNYLNAIRYSSLPQRLKCIYHLIESNLHQNCGRLEEAKKSLDLTLSISKQHNFELETSSAQTRLQNLHVRQT